MQSNLDAAHSAVFDINDAAVVSAAADPVDFLMAVVSDNAGQVEALRAELAQMRALMQAMSEKEAARERVFDALHHELQDYKDDFVAQRTKPLLRALLFLHDSLLQFHSELEQRATQAAPLEASTCIALTQQNLHWLREQLEEALLVAQVTPAEATLHFDPHRHKALQVEAVPPSQHNAILKVLRRGWNLKDQTLRPAEVVVGKSSS